MDLNKIGKFIADNRKRQNLTQKELGELLNINSKTISKWERGVNAPDISLLTELSKYLRVSVEEILAGERIKKDKFTKKFINKLYGKSNKVFKVTIITFIILIIASITLISVYKYKFNNQKIEVYKISSDNEEYFIAGSLVTKNDEYSFVISEIKIADEKKFKNTTKDKKFIALHIGIFNNGNILYSYTYNAEEEYSLHQELQNIRFEFKHYLTKDTNVNVGGNNELIIKYCDVNNECHVTNVYLNLKKTK